MKKQYPLNPEFRRVSADSGAGGGVRHSDNPLIREGNVKTIPQAEDLADLVDTIIAARSRRRHFMSADLFSEPAWEMLLALYRADVADYRITVSSLCRASDGPATTALRWIDKLEELEMVTKRKNPIDGRVIFVELTGDTRRLMQNYLTETWVALFSAP